VELPQLDPFWCRSWFVDKTRFTV